MAVNTGGQLTEDGFQLALVMCVYHSDLSDHTDGSLGLVFRSLDTELRSHL